MDYVRKYMGYSDSGDVEQHGLDSAIEAIDQREKEIVERVGATKKEEEKNKSTSKGGFFKRWTEKKETQAEFYARMDREQAERDAERQKKKLEEQQKAAEEKRRKDEIKRVEEEKKRKLYETEAAERMKVEEERSRKAKEDLEEQLRMHREKTARILEDQRRRTEHENQRAKDEREYQEKLRRIEEDRLMKERLDREREMERRNEELRRFSMQQLQSSNQTAASAIDSAVAAAAAEDALNTERTKQALAVENEAQRQLNLRTELIQRDLERSAREEEIKTSMFVKEVDDSIRAAILELERKKARELEESRMRDKEREDALIVYERELIVKREKEEEKLREKNRLYAETSERIHQEKELGAAQYEQDLERMRAAHNETVDRLLREERRKMEELNEKMREKEEERRMQWNRMREAFINMMRARYNGMMNNETESKWDERFNELRRSYDPVKEAFWKLESVPLRKTEVAASLIQFEAHLNSLRMTLTTLEDIMTTEENQVTIWKDQQPDAHFLNDFGSALSAIIDSIARVRREMGMVEDGVETNRNNVGELERVFELRYLTGAVRELRDAVDSIPTVYDINKKYANVTRRTEIAI